jgi:hypothetical protein
LAAGRRLVGSWLAAGWQLVGSSLAAGWQLVGSWLVAGWQLVGGWLAAGRRLVGVSSPDANHSSINKASQRYHAYIPAVGGLGEGSSV